jgi:hypothetical protein
MVRGVRVNILFCQYFRLELLAIGLITPQWSLFIAEKFDGGGRGEGVAGSYRGQQRQRAAAAAGRNGLRFYVSIKFATKLACRAEVDRGYQGVLVLGNGIARGF